MNDWIFWFYDVFGSWRQKRRWKVESKSTTSTMISLDFLQGVNNVCWCPPTSLGRATQGLPREQEEQFAHSQPRHGGFGRREKKTPNIQNPSLRAIMWRIPPLLLLLCPPSLSPSLFSSSLLFFSFLIKPSGVVRSFETRTPSHVKS